MSDAVLSKSKYAKRCNVSTAAVYKWIQRGKLTAAALTADGKIIVAVADAQLAVSIHPVRGAIAAAKAAEAAADDPRETHAPPAARVAPESSGGYAGGNRASMQLLQARALSASCEAETKRQKLNLDRGKYMLASAASAEFARVLSGFLERVESSFADLGVEMRLDREQVLALRRWWRAQRAGAAGVARDAGAGEAEFVEDVAA